MDASRQRLPLPDIPGDSDDARLEFQISLITNDILAGQIPPMPVQCPADLETFQPLFVQEDTFEPYVRLIAWTGLLVACAKHPILVPYLREQEYSFMHKVAQGVKARTKSQALGTSRPNLWLSGQSAPISGGTNTVTALRQETGPCKIIDADNPSSGYEKRCSPNSQATNTLLQQCHNPFMVMRERFGLGGNEAHWRVSVAYVGEQTFTPPNPQKLEPHLSANLIQAIADDDYGISIVATRVPKVFTLRFRIRSSQVHHLLAWLFGMKVNSIGGLRRFPILGVVNIPTHVTLSKRERDTMLRMFTDDIGPLILEGLAAVLGEGANNHDQMMQIIVPTRDDQDAVLAMDIPSDVAVVFKDSWR